MESRKRTRKARTVVASRCTRLSRLAGVATGGVSSRYLTDDLTLGMAPSSRVGGHPQARATLGTVGNQHTRIQHQELFCILYEISNYVLGRQTPIRTQSNE